MKDIIAVDLGGTNLKVAWLTSDFKIRDKRILKTPSAARREPILRAIDEAVGGLIRQNRLPKSGFLGAGIGLPGPVDNESGLVHFLPNIPGFCRINLKQILSKRLGMPVHVDNDANLMCLAEHTLGAARGVDFALCLTLGTGVGGGLIIDGKLYRGSRNAAGEAGHIPLSLDGPLCNCGGRGCLEAYIGNSRILKEARAAFSRTVTLEELSDLARRRDKKALMIWELVGQRLGVALTGLINVLNLEAVVIGGGVSRAGAVLFQTVRRTVRQRAMPVQARSVKIVKAALGYDAGLIGAAIMVRKAGRK